MDLSDHMAQVEREIDNKIEEKRRQAANVPTLLLLDLARVGWSWLRGSAWLPFLEAKLSGEPFGGIGVFFSSLDSDVPLGLHVRLEPGASSELEDALAALATTFGLTTIA